ncbi:MAG: ABC transporter permease [Anaerolineae bacterium]|nr:ABC transporter permease [Anaerolineae bacterium]NUQ03752.1 ABC transporter permease [Anaerolineae bacterium]
MVSTTTRALLNRLFNVVPLLVAVIAALVVASFLLAALNADIATAYGAMFQGAFGTVNATAETLVKAIPILFVAIGICVAFRGNVVNIGGEGQMIFGALAGVAVTLWIGESLGVLVVPLALIAGFVAGGFFGGLAGYLKAFFNVNEILSTIMLNQVAVQIMNYLLNGPLLDPAAAGSNNIPKTARIAEIAELPRLVFGLPGMSEPLFDRTRLHYGFVIAVVLAIVIYILLWRTAIGYRIRAVGYNERASRYAGIKVGRQMVLAMFLAGGCAGLAGAVQVLGLQYRLQTDGSPAGFTGGAGFNGIVAALFGGLNPFGAIPASIFFGGLLVGAQNMQRAVGIPAALVTTINGLIVVFVVSSQIFTQVRNRRRAKLLIQPERIEARAATAETPL